MGSSLQQARVPWDTEHQPVSGVFTRLFMPTEPCYPLKATPGEMFAPAPQIMENEGQTCFKYSPQLPPLSILPMRSWFLLRFCFDFNILCSTEASQSLHKTSY